MPRGRPWEVKSLLQVTEPSRSLVLTQQAFCQLEGPKALWRLL